MTERDEFLAYLEKLPEPRPLLRVPRWLRQLGTVIAWGVSFWITDTRRRA